MEGYSLVYFIVCVDFMVITFLIMSLGLAIDLFVFILYICVFKSVIVHDNIVLKVAESDLF